MQTNHSNIGRVIITLAILAIVIIIFIYLRGCGKRYAVTTTTIDTVYIDTSKIITKVDTHYIPSPYKVIIRGESSPQKVTEVILQTSPFDSAYTEALKKAYFDTTYYNDVVYNDSSGMVTVTDTITENKITGRRVKAELTNTIITSQITITKTLPRRITGYWGIQGGGNKSNIFTTGGITAGLMDRRGRYYGLSANLLLNGKPFYGGQVMFPIHLKK